MNKGVKEGAMWTCEGRAFQAAGTAGAKALGQECLVVSGKTSEVSFGQSEWGVGDELRGRRTGRL